VNGECAADLGEVCWDPLSLSKGTLADHRPIMSGT